MDTRQRPAITRTITLTQFHQEARARFGDDPQLWAYQCPACGHIATLADIAYALSQQPAATAIRHGLNAGQVLGQQCIACGAKARDVGTTLVRLPDGREARVFELAPKEAK